MQSLRHLISQWNRLRSRKANQKKKAAPVRLELRRLEDRWVPANASGTISGSTFIDQNLNAQRELTEAALPGVNVHLIGRTFQGQQVNVTARTDSNGSFRFLHVQPGSYVVHATPPPGILGPSTTSVTSFLVRGGQNVQKVIGFRGIDPNFVSLRPLLSTPISGVLPNQTPGTGVAQASLRANNRPFVRTTTDANALRNIAANKNAPDRLINLNAIFGDPDFNTGTESLRFRVVSNSNPELLTASIQGQQLKLDFSADKEGETILVVRAIDRFGATVATTIKVTVTNQAPTATVTLTPESPKTNDTLTATVVASDPNNDPITLTYVWRVDGEVKKTTENTTATTDTFDLSIPGHGDRGQTITVEVTASDGSLTSDLATDSVLVLNSEPTISVSLDNTEPFTNDTITATISDANDPDGDPITWTFTWKVNGVTVRTVPNTTNLTDSLDLSIAGNGNRGDVITVEVVASDGNLNSSPATATATVQNTAPEAGDIPDQFFTGPGLFLLDTSVVFSDLDGETLTFTAELEDGAPLPAWLTISTNGLLSGNPSVNDEGIFLIKVTATDPGGLSASTTFELTVSNTPESLNDVPIVNSVELSSTSPLTNDTLIATVDAVDGDGDQIRLTYVWKVNGVVVKTTTDTTSLTDSLDLSQAGNGDRGDVITVEVTPADELSTGATVTTTATVANSAPTAVGLTLDPQNPGTNDLLNAIVDSVFDPDGDLVTLTFRWLVNGVVVQETTGVTDLSDILDLALDGFGDTGDTIVVEVIPSDGDLEGPMISDSTTVI